jgi:hypothetical protein
MREARDRAGMWAARGVAQLHDLREERERPQAAVRPERPALEARRESTSKFVQTVPLRGMQM